MVAGDLMLIPFVLKFIEKRDKGLLCLIDIYIQQGLGLGEHLLKSYSVTTWNSIMSTL